MSHGPFVYASELVKSHLESKRKERHQDVRGTKQRNALLSFSSIQSCTWHDMVEPFNNNNNNNRNMVCKGSRMAHRHPTRPIRTKVQLKKKYAQSFVRNRGSHICWRMFNLPLLSLPAHAQLYPSPSPCILRVMCASVVFGRGFFLFPSAPSQSCGECG